MGNILRKDESSDEEFIDPCPNDLDIEIIIENGYAPKPIFMEDIHKIPDKTLEQRLESLDKLSNTEFIDALSDYAELFANKSTDPKNIKSTLKTLITVTTIAIRKLKHEKYADVVFQFVEHIMLSANVVKSRNASRIVEMYNICLANGYNECAMHIILSTINTGNKHILSRLAHQVLIASPTEHPCVEHLVMTYIGSIEWETVKPSAFRLLTSLTIASHLRYPDLYKTLLDIITYDILHYRNGDDALACYLAVYLTASYENKLDIIPVIILIEELLISNNVLCDPKSVEIIEAIIQNLITTYNDQQSSILMLKLFGARTGRFEKVNANAAMSLLHSSYYYGDFDLAKPYIHMACISATADTGIELYDMLTSMMFNKGDVHHSQTDNIMSIMCNIMTIYGDSSVISSLYYMILVLYIENTMMHNIFPEKIKILGPFVALALYPTPNAPEEYLQVHREGIMQLCAVLMVTRDQFPYYAVFMKELYESWNSIIVTQEDRETFLEILSEQLNFPYKRIQRLIFTEESIKVVKRILQDYQLSK